MTKSTTVKVSNRYQIALPSVARQALQISVGDRLLVDVQDGIIILVPQPTDYVEHLAGLHQELWQGIDSNHYLEQEREAWTSSKTS